MESDFVFMGHSHYPFVRYQDAVCFVNVGSVGLPRDDGRYGACALFDSTHSRVEVFRFDISDCSKPLLDGDVEMHDSVRAIFERRKEQVFGKVIREDAK